MTESEIRSSRVSKTVTPPGGWQYQQGNTILVSETADLLISNVKTHRIHNGMVVGDVWKDIEDQMIAKNPHLYKNQVLA